jgi:acyl dehydratase
MSLDVSTVSVGTELPTLELAPISRTTLALFAGASGDHNPIHLDLDVAKSAGLPDVFAQGMLSMAYLGRLLTNWVPQERIRSFEVRFAAITPVHGQPTCRGTVTTIDTVDGAVLATVDISVVLADGTLTLSGRAVVEID